MRFKSAFTIVPVAIVLAACASTADDIYTPEATAAADDVAVTDSEAGLDWAAADTGAVAVLDVSVGTQAVTGSTIAQAAAATAGTNFSPSGCATATASGNVVTYVLKDCTGPLGVVSATGTFTSTLTPTGQGLQIQLAGKNVKINNATIDIQTQGMLTSTNGGTSRTFQATTMSSGTGPYGSSTSRTGSYTLAWQTGTTCGTLNANFMDSAAATSTSVSHYQRCRGQCPQSGAVTRTFPAGNVTVTYNGTNSGSWKANNGNTGTVALRCP